MVTYGFPPEYFFTNFIISSSSALIGRSSIIWPQYDRKSSGAKKRVLCCCKVRRCCLSRIEASRPSARLASRSDSLKMSMSSAYRMKSRPFAAMLLSTGIDKRRLGYKVDRMGSNGHAAGNAGGGGFQERNYPF